MQKVVVFAADVGACAAARRGGRRGVRGARPQEMGLGREGREAPALKAHLFIILRWPAHVNF